MQPTESVPGHRVKSGTLEPWARDAIATDHERIMLCGSGARRGGAVSGIGGHNAAMAVLACLASRRKSP